MRPKSNWEVTEILQARQTSPTRVVAEMVEIVDGHQDWKKDVRNSGL